jgi:hypothetical protein
MNYLRISNCRPGLLIVLSFALSLASPVPEACVPPSYKVGRTLETNATDTMLNISISLEDFVPKRLVCLAEALRQKYSDRNLDVTIFSVREVARSYYPEVERTARTVYMNSKLHASYTYNKEKHEDYLFLVPDGRSLSVDSPFNTQINLPLSGAAPICRLAVNGRCLLEFQHLYYPFFGSKTIGSGEVTVTGRIRRSGVMSSVAAIDAKATSPEWRSAFTAAAIRNLRTWHFEPGVHQDPVSITYRFEVSDSVRGEDLQFQLPNEVRVRTHGNH